MKLNYRWKRFRVVFRRWKRSLDNTIKIESNKLTAYEEKGIKLWKMVVREPNSKLAYNSYGVRQIEKDTLFIIVTPLNGSERYNMTIMDITKDRRSLYELHIEGKPAINVIESFDDEMERRMRKAENSKRTLIETDIDKLIAEEEKLIAKKVEIEKQKQSRLLAEQK